MLPEIAYRSMQNGSDDDVEVSFMVPCLNEEANVVGTLNVLEASRRADVVRVVQVSTSEVYGTPLAVPIAKKVSAVPRLSGTTDSRDTANRMPPTAPMMPPMARDWSL